MSLGANDIGRDQREVAGPRADIEHLHAGSDSGRAEYLPRHRVGDPTLSHESLALGVTLVEPVGGSRDIDW